MKSYIINLDKDTERLKRTLYCLENSLGVLPVDMERVPAIYGKELTRKERLGVVTKSYNFFARDAEIGCAMSHLLAWRTFVSQAAHDDDCAAFFEDDIFVRPQNAFSLEEIRLITSVDHSAAEPPRVVFLGSLFKSPQIGEPIRGGVKSGWFKNVLVFGTHSYVLTKAAALAMLNDVSINKLSVPIDKYIIDLSKKKLVQSCVHKPGLVEQASNGHDAPFDCESSLHHSAFPTFAAPLEYLRISNGTMSVRANLGVKICQLGSSELEISMFHTHISTIGFIVGAILSTQKILYVLLILILLLNTDAIEYARETAITFICFSLALAAGKFCRYIADRAIMSVRTLEV